MAQSYTIYLRDKTSTTKPTQPKEEGTSLTAPKKEGVSIMSMAKSGQFLTKLGYAGIAVVVAKKVIDTADKIISKIEPFITRESGDYRFNVAYGNVKSVKNAIANPLSTAYSVVTIIHTNIIANKRQEQQRALLGDTFINSTDRKF